MIRWEQRKHALPHASAFIAIAVQKRLSLCNTTTRKLRLLFVEHGAGFSEGCGKTLGAEFQNALRLLGGRDRLLISPRLHDAFRDAERASEQPEAALAAAEFVDRRRHDGRNVHGHSARLSLQKSPWSAKTKEAPPGVGMGKPSGAPSRAEPEAAPSGGTVTRATLLRRASGHCGPSARRATMGDTTKPMEDSMDPDVRAVRDEVRNLAMFTGQALAVLVADDPAKRDALDQIIAAWEGLAPSAGGKAIMTVVRGAADKMLSAARQSLQDE